MIYSDDINRVCGLCTHSDKLTESALRCRLHRKNVSVTDPDCGKFEYDIFKKTVRRKKRLKTGFDPKDFSLD
ncbi:MAG: hypothetical protein IJH37_07025 [Clostridia bacterium]|nr:hypothetical protein [Clostridia bacterium]